MKVAMPEKRGRTMPETGSTGLASSMVTLRRCASRRAELYAPVVFSNRESQAVSACAQGLCRARPGDAGLWRRANWLSLFLRTQWPSGVAKMQKIVRKQINSLDFCAAQIHIVHCDIADVATGTDLRSVPGRFLPKLGPCLHGPFFLP